MIILGTAESAQIQCRMLSNRKWEASRDSNIPSGADSLHGNSLSEHPKIRPPTRDVMILLLGGSRQEPKDQECSVALFFMIKTIKTVIMWVHLDAANGSLCPAPRTIFPIWGWQLAPSVSRSNWSSNLSTRKIPLNGKKKLANSTNVMDLHGS